MPEKSKMTDSQKELMEEFRSLVPARTEALIQKRREELERDLAILPLRIEALCLGLQDAKLRSLIQELGRLENLLDKSPPTLKSFVFDLREKKAKEILKYLSKYKKHDYKTQKILNYLSENYSTTE